VTHTRYLNEMEDEGLFCHYDHYDSCIRFGKKSEDAFINNIVA